MNHIPLSDKEEKIDEAIVVVKNKKKINTKTLLVSPSDEEKMVTEEQKVHKDHKGIKVTGDE